MQNSTSSKKNNHWSFPGSHEPKSIIVDFETKTTKVLPMNYSMMEKLGTDTKKAAHPNNFFPIESFGYNKKTCLK